MDKNFKFPKLYTNWIFLFIAVKKSIYHILTTSYGVLEGQLLVFKNIFSIRYIRYINVAIVFETEILEYHPRAEKRSYYLKKKKCLQINN